MSFWMREASLQIGSKKYSMDNLYFEFEVPFEDSDTIQTAKFKAYNLSESTRKGIKRGDVIILNAGYEGDVGAIFAGQVSACQPQAPKYRVDYRNLSNRRYGPVAQLQGLQDLRQG